MAYADTKDGASGIADHDPLFGDCHEARSRRRALACDLTDLSTFCRAKGFADAGDWRRVKPGASLATAQRSFDRALARMRLVEDSLPWQLRLVIENCPPREGEESVLASSQKRNRVSFRHGIPNAAQIEDLLGMRSLDDIDDIRGH